MTILDKIETEAWHFLTSIYTHQRLLEGLTNSATRFELANQLLAFNAFFEMLVIRIARLADKRKDARSVSMLMKRGTFPAPTATVKVAADNYVLLAEPIVNMWHERVEHMKPGVLSSYEPQDLPAEALRAAESLINIIDIARGQPLSYKYKDGSMEPVIDFRASLKAGELVTV